MSPSSPAIGCLLVLAAASLGKDTGSGQTRIDTLAWLSGCWALDGEAAGSGEHWLPPAGGAMLGIGRSIRDGRMVSYEYLRIEETSDGSLQLFASPGGQSTTGFRLASIGAVSVEFENPEHDFPQRIRYERTGSQLTGHASADRDGVPVALEFPMTRIRCEHDEH